MFMILAPRAVPTGPPKFSPLGREKDAEPVEESDDADLDDNLDDHELLEEQTSAQDTNSPGNGQTRQSDGDRESSPSPSI
jgi:hypothetical protein